MIVDGCFESRHNLHYWHCDEYLGIGPSAHSFLKGRRFYFERDFDRFLTEPTPIDDGEGGSEEEVGVKGVGLQDFPGPLGLFDAVLAQRHVHPSREPVFQVPLALSVPQKN